MTLQELRKAAAERFLAIGMAYVPEGWTYAYRKSLSGRCWYERKHIEGPRPVTRKSLYIWLHECAHAHGISRATKRRPVHVIEMQAELWAHERMREHGIAVPKAMTERAKRYVARKIKQAGPRAKIDPAARAFAGRVKPKR